MKISLVIIFILSILQVHANDKDWGFYENNGFHRLDNNIFSELNYHLDLLGLLPVYRKNPTQSTLLGMNQIFQSPFLQHAVFLKYNTTGQINHDTILKDGANYLFNFKDAYDKTYTLILINFDNSKFLTRTIRTIRKVVMGGQKTSFFQKALRNTISIILPMAYANETDISGRIGCMSREEFQSKFLAMLNQDVPKILGETTLAFIGKCAYDAGSGFISGAESVLEFAGYLYDQGGRLLTMDIAELYNMYKQGLRAISSIINNNDWTEFINLLPPHLVEFFQRLQGLFLNTTSEQKTEFFCKFIGAIGFEYALELFTYRAAGRVLNIHQRIIRSINRVLREMGINSAPLNFNNNPSTTQSNIQNNNVPTSNPTSLNLTVTNGSNSLQPQVTTSPNTNLNLPSSTRPSTNSSLSNTNVTIPLNQNSLNNLLDQKPDTGRARQNTNDNIISPCNSKTFGKPCPYTERSQTDEFLQRRSQISNLRRELNPKVEKYRDLKKQWKETKEKINNGEISPNSPDVLQLKRELEITKQEAIQVNNQLIALMEDELYELGIEYRRVTGFDHENPEFDLLILKPNETAEALSHMPNLPPYIQQILDKQDDVDFDLNESIIIYPADSFFSRNNAGGYYSNVAYAEDAYIALPVTPSRPGDISLIIGHELGHAEVATVGRAGRDESMLTIQTHRTDRTDNNTRLSESDLYSNFRSNDELFTYSHDIGRINSILREYINPPNKVEINRNLKRFKEGLMEVKDMASNIAEETETFIKLAKNALKEGVVDSTYIIKQARRWEGETFFNFEFNGKKQVMKITKKENIELIDKMRDGNLSQRERDNAAIEFMNAMIDKQTRLNKVAKERIESSTDISNLVDIELDKIQNNDFSTIAELCDKIDSSRISDLPNKALSTSDLK